MKASKENTAPYFFKAWKLLGLALLFILASQIGYAQNTKGAEVNRVNKPKRESRFKIPTKKKKKQKGPTSYNRVKGRGSSAANSARKTPSSKKQKVYPQHGRFVNNNSTKSRDRQKVHPQKGPSVNRNSRDGNNQRAWKGDITGRRIRAPRSSEKTRNVFPQYGRYGNNPSRKGRHDHQKAWRGTASGSRLKVRSNTGKTRNVFPQYGRYVNNPSRKGSKKTEPMVSSNRTTISRLNRLKRSHARSSSGGRKQAISPRSASHSFMARKSINVYANFRRPKPKGEQAHLKDISGRKLRTKNFETPRREVLTPTFKPYRGRKRVGDKAYQGRAAGSHQSVSRKSERAWKGNISGNKIRGRNYSSKPHVEGSPIFPNKNRRPRGKDRVYRGTMPTSGHRTATLPGEARTGKRPLPARAPGIGANRIGKFQGNIKGRRSAIGGGSVSGRSWNNKGSALPVRTPSAAARRAGGYRGSIKFLGQSAPGFNDQGEGFTGYKKAKRPPKGGGSVSGRVWNNRGKPVGVKIPVQGARAGSFQGNLKTKRPEKGGGSISGRVWNNKQKPLPPFIPPHAAQRAGKFKGNAKRFEQSPSMVDQGEEFTGFVKLRKFKKNYVKNPNSAALALKKKSPDKSTYEVGGLQVKVKERDYVQNKNSARESILKKSPTKSTYQTGGLQVRVKERDYVQNKNAAKESILKKSPTKSTYQTGDLQVRMKERDYVQNKNAAKESLLKKKPTRATYQVGELQIKVKQAETGKKPHAAEGSMPGIKPSKSSVKASEYARGVKRTWNYIHNPSSADEAQKTREPGKAFGKMTDYQGNIKMQKFHLFEKNRHLHPDATFVKTNKNNVDGERDLLTNLKLWWAKKFKKQDTQPDNLKDKGKRPRYDKREDGLWYE